MSKNISEKIKEVRISEGLTQPKFAEDAGFSVSTLKKYEGGHNEPGFDAVKKICAAFPQYTMYLMFDEMPESAGPDQITPEEKTLRDLSTSEKTA